MDVLYEVALSRLKGMGGATARQLIARHQSAEAFFSLGPAAIRKLYPRIDFPSSASSLKQFIEHTRRFIQQQQGNNVEIVTWKHHLYPARLKHIPDAPMVLFCKGNTYPKHDKVVSIVGTRRASGYGIERVKELVSSLQPWNPVIVSGLAYGIDAQAHKSALAHNLPTLAVMANGIDKVYPSAHRSLAAEIAGCAGLITEYPLGTNPEIYQFPERNRIIAGLSDITVVVEAGEKGGALITADLANDYNREVAAIPGDVTRQTALGCHKIIKQHKAHLITSGNDIVRLLNWEKPTKTTSDKQLAFFPDLNSKAMQILSLLQREHTGMPVDHICVETCLPVSEVMRQLLQMELEGVVRQLPGNVYRSCV